MTAADEFSASGERFCEQFLAIVVVPAKNEAERIFACLAALANQRDSFGAPLPAGMFEILVYANNCSDATVKVARACAAISPQPIKVVCEDLPPERSNAGMARKRAMDCAADRLRESASRESFILTTDADSCVSPDWFAATLAAFAQGADCVAGYVDADPSEMMTLGAAFLRRARLEDRYARAVAEIYALSDPRPHDPWPNHRVSSGASIAVTTHAYLSVGGLPERAVGEDAALTYALECAGFRVRHAMGVQVYTSCRFDGRAEGGAADTMRHRHAVEDAPCDDDLEPALFVARRALYKGALRQLRERGLLHRRDLRPRLLSRSSTNDCLFCAGDEAPFEQFWTQLVAASPCFEKRVALRPSDLPRQIRRAQMILGRLRSADRHRRRSGDAINLLGRVGAQTPEPSPAPLVLRNQRADCGTESILFRAEPHEL